MSSRPRLHNGRDNGGQSVAPSSLAPHSARGAARIQISAGTAARINKNNNEPARGGAGQNPFHKAAAEAAAGETCGGGGGPLPPSYWVGRARGEEDEEDAKRAEELRQARRPKLQEIN